MCKYLYGEIDTPIEIYEYSKKPSLKTINNFINKYPNRPEIYIILARLLETKNSINALKYYKIAIKLNPNNAAYYAITARFLLKIGYFYDSIDMFTYLIDHKELQNYKYYSCRNGGLRLIAACCIGDWKIAKEDIIYIDSNYIFYTKPIIGIITKDRLLNSIKKREKLKVKL